MSRDTVVRARIDSETKARAAEALLLSVSEIRLKRNGCLLPSSRRQGDARAASALFQDSG